MGPEGSAVEVVCRALTVLGKGQGRMCGDLRGVPLCSQVLTQVSTSQASLLWQELEAEEETAKRRNAWRSCGRRAKNLASECPDEGHVRYFVLGTMAAIVALFLNVFYPLIYQTRWR